MKKTTIAATILFLSITLCLMAVFVRATPTVTTDEADYSPGDTVTVMGAGFAPGESLAVVVIRPDNTIVIGDGSFTIGWDNVTVDENGAFTYKYQLDGIAGVYNVLVYPPSWDGDLALEPIAKTTFTDAYGIQQVRTSDSSGSVMNLFAPGADVWAVIGTSGGTGSSNVRIYVLSTLPAVGGSLSDVSGGYEEESWTSASNTVPRGPFEIWSSASRGNYVVFVDEANYGVRDSGEKYDSFTVAMPGTTLTADLSATAHWMRTFAWTIDKSVTPATWNLFTGDSGTSQYTIALTKDAGTDEYYVDGTVTVTNGGSNPTDMLAITINLEYGPSWPTIASITLDLSGHPIIGAGGSYSYPYKITIPSPYHTGSTYRIEAYVTIMNHNGHLGSPFGPSPQSDTILPSTPTPINNEIHVTDTNGGSWTFSASGSQTYTKTFTAADEGDNDNTATITETDQTADATVTVNVYDLEVTKDASTSFTRTYGWSIDKSADQTELHLSTGESTSVGYTVTVDTTGSTDSDWAVTGNIHVHNPAPMAAVITSVSDVVSGVGDATVDMGVTFPYTLAAGATLDGTYTLSLPDASTRTNTATATLQNYDYDYLLSPTESSTTDFSGTASVSFSSPTITDVHKTVTVTDTLQGTLGTLTYGVDTLPTTYTYSRTIGPYATTGERDIDNTASVKSGDTTLDSDGWEVVVYVEGSEFCAITSKGYQDITTFKLIFTPDVPTYPSFSRLTASNPGQFSFNVFFDTEGGDVVTMSIPYPFVTQGANPVHIYTGVSGNIPTGTDITSLFDLSGSGVPVTLNSYTGTKTFGDTTTITITVPAGYNGPIYITVHLDYGLKKIAGDYSKNTALDALKNSGSGYASILNNNAYTFSVSNAFTGSDSISNVNEFKNDPGIGGLVFDQYGALVNAKVDIYQGKTLLGTVYTDADGWYMYNYKYTGKATSFTVKVPSLGAEQTVTLKANGFLVVSFGV